jgi:hypothetical protein
MLIKKIIHSFGLEYPRSGGGIMAQVDVPIAFAIFWMIHGREMEAGDSKTPSYRKNLVD